VVFAVVSMAAISLSAVASTPLLDARVPQGVVDSPSFEVASIKQDTGDVLRMGGPDVSQFRATGVTARLLIDFAYQISDFQLIGGPKWTASEKFDVDAKVQDSIAEQLRELPHVQQQEQLRLMLQSLLADRFALKITRSTKELPVFNLVLAKGGAKLTLVAPPPPETSVPFPALPSPDTPGLAQGGTEISLLPGDKASLAGKAVPVQSLANMLTALLGRQVVDQTGLQGSYDFVLFYTRDAGLESGVPPSPNASAPSPDGAGTSLFTALQEQLGLRLESAKGPVQTIVIDQIKEPSPN